MNVLAAVLLSGGANGGVFLLLAASMSALYCAGMCLNDICDREVDARQQPFRPIPSGRIELKEAWWLTAVLLGSGLGLLCLAPVDSAVMPGLALVALIFAYDRLHKAHPATVLLMAGCRFMVFAVCGWAVAGTLSPLVVAGGGLCFVYTLLISVVARHENTRGTRYSFPAIPWMIAAMSLVDGAFVAVVIAPAWLLAGFAAALLTHFGQRFVRGD